MSFEDAATERDKAIARVDANANETWKTVALETVKEVAYREKEFLAHAVREALEVKNVQTHTLKALGPVIRRAQKLGWISPSGRYAPRPSGHLTAAMVWKSNICQQA